MLTTHLLAQILGLGILCLIGFFTAVNLCGIVRKRLIARNMLDNPNERSMHEAAVPRGGGLALWLAVIPVWMVVLVMQGMLPLYGGLLSGVFLLASISWFDDKKSLSPLIRLTAHIAAVVFGLSFLTDGQLVFQGVLPLWLDRVIAALAWVWFVNLTNFMDGIDGISGAQSMHIATGFILIGMCLGLKMVTGFSLAAVLLGASLGFLIWNWHPAKLFLGDVGSVPLGYILGFLMLLLAAFGQLAIALVLPLYYVADATITLVRRMIEKKKFWQPHREHFYQQAAMAVGHIKTVKVVILGNAGLLALALLSLKTSPWLLLLAPLLVAGMLWYLNRLAQTPVTTQN